MPSPNATPTPITPPRVPLIDPRTGLIDRAWYLFFLSLNDIATGVVDDVNLGTDALSLLASYDAALQALAQEVETQPPPVDLSAELIKQIQAAGLEDCCSGLLSQVAEMQKQLEALSLLPPPAQGTVTAVMATAPVVSSGGTAPDISLAAGYGDTQNPYAAKTANFVLAGPTAGAAAVPTFRALVAADIPALPYGTGDVVGPASATDNAIARYNLTTGKLIQNSLVIVDDTGSVTGVNSLTAESLTVNNNATFGTSNSDTINFVGRINSDFDPATDNTYDLGRVGHEWRDLYIDGTANIDSLIADTADINAGTIDNTTIGATTPQNGSFVDLSVTGTTSFDGAQGTSGQVLTSAGTGNTPTWTTPTTGTVTAVSVVSANGFAGTSSGGATPALTLTTTITGLLKGNGTAISAAVANTDYMGVGAPVTKTADFTVANGEIWYINNKSGSTCTVTLPAASSWTGRTLTFKNMQAQTLVSASSNVVPIDSTTAGTAILLAVVGNWATMVSDGTNWVIMQQAANNCLLLE
jgi:hypothetical protein